MAQSRSSTSADIDELVDQWDAHIVECRADGHRWHRSAAVFNTRYRYYSVTHICESCHSTRHQELNEYGHPIRRWYDYVDGYLTKGIGKIGEGGRDLIRLRALVGSGIVKNTSKNERPRWVIREAS